MNQERDPESGLFIIYSDDDVPLFASDEEEREFWDTHTNSPERLEEFGPPPPGLLPPPRRGTRDTIALDQRTSRRLSAVAAARRTTPAALARQFLRERLTEEEQRTGS
jgi:hypothetical protein